MPFGWNFWFFGKGKELELCQQKLKEAENEIHELNTTYRIRTFENEKKYKLDRENKIIKSFVAKDPSVILKELSELFSQMGEAPDQFPTYGLTQDDGVVEIQAANGWTFILVADKRVILPGYKFHNAEAEMYLLATAQA
jgi:hypothetical protein